VKSYTPSATTSELSSALFIPKLSHDPQSSFSPLRIRQSCDVTQRLNLARPPRVERTALPQTGDLIDAMRGTRLFARKQHWGKRKVKRNQ
jgi:hypothetical protein